MTFMAWLKQSLDDICTNLRVLFPETSQKQSEKVTPIAHGTWLNRESERIPRSLLRG
jgi:hypothetical protein